MWGFELTLENNTKADGCIFADGTCYVHEPIADSYASVQDMLIDNPTMHFEVIGPMVAIELVKRAMSNEYERTKMQLKDASEVLERNYRANLYELERLDSGNVPFLSTKEAT